MCQSSFLRRSLRHSSPGPRRHRLSRVFPPFFPTVNLLTVTRPPAPQSSPARRRLSSALLPSASVLPHLSKSKLFCSFSKGLILNSVGLRKEFSPCFSSGFLCVCGFWGLFWGWGGVWWFFSPPLPGGATSGRWWVGSAPRAREQTYVFSHKARQALLLVKNQ